MMRQTRNPGVTRGSTAALGVALALALTLTPLAAAELSYVYDEIGRLTTVVHGDSLTVSYEYDANGNILSVAVESGMLDVGESEPPALPTTFGLGHPPENPVRHSTRIPFQLAGARKVTLDVYDAVGRRVRRLVEGPMPAGFHDASWDGLTDGGATAAPGVYLYRIVAGSYTATRKLVLVR